MTDIQQGLAKSDQKLASKKIDIEANRGTKELQPSWILNFLVQIIKIKNALKNVVIDREIAIISSRNVI